MKKICRNYQTEVVSRVAADAFDYLIEHPTGSGKTLMLVALAALLVRQGRHVLIAAPQEHIEQGFTRRDYEEIDVGGEVLAVPPETVRAARADRQSVRAVLDYLSDPPPGYALACTHATLTKIRPPSVNLPVDMKGRVLIVDEAHHASATGLSQLVGLWRKAGGRLVFATATAYRSDDDPVVLPDMKVLRRSLPEHMEAGFAPGRIKSEIVAVNVERVTAREFYGEAEVRDDSARAVMIRRMLESWAADGRPKAVVRVPPVRGGTGGMVAEIEAAFRGAGARVLNVAGNRREDKQRFLTALKDERARTYSESRYDVIVGVARVAEGMDWPHCSHVFCVGFPVSVHTIAQLLGRATRQKGEDCPEPFRGEAVLRMFVPCGTAGTVESMPAYHVQNVLLVCAYLANFQSGQTWNVIKEIGRGVVVPLGTSDRDAVRRVADEFPYVDPVVRGEVLNAISQAQASLREQGSESPTDEQVAVWLFTHRPDLGRATVRQVIVETVVAEGGRPAGKVKEELLANIRRLLADGRPLREAVLAAFREASLELMTGNVLSVAAEVGVFRHQVVSLTGREVIRHGSVMSRRPWMTVEWVTEQVVKYHEANGRYPDAESGDVPGYPGHTWAWLDGRMSRVYQQQWAGDPAAKGLPIGSPNGLAALVDELKGATVADAVRQGLAELRPEDLPQGRAFMASVSDYADPRLTEAVLSLLDWMPSSLPGADRPLGGLAVRDVRLAVNHNRRGDTGSRVSLRHLRWGVDDGLTVAMNGGGDAATAVYLLYAMASLDEYLVRSPHGWVVSELFDCDAPRFKSLFTQLFRGRPVTVDVPEVVQHPTLGSRITVPAGRYHGTLAGCPTTTGWRFESRVLLYKTSTTPSLPVYLRFRRGAAPQSLEAVPGGDQAPRSPADLPDPHGVDLPITWLVIDDYPAKLAAAARRSAELWAERARRSAGPNGPRYSRSG